MPKTRVLVSVVVLVFVLAVAVALEQELVYRDGDACYPMAYNQCYQCSALDVALQCTDVEDDDDEEPRCLRSSARCGSDDDDDGDFSSVVRAPCKHIPQCAIAYAAAEVDGFMVAADRPLHVQRLSSSKAGILALDGYDANFMGILNTVAFGTDEGSVFVKGLLANGTVVTNAGMCPSGSWCQAPGGLTYSKYTSYYNDSLNGFIGMDGNRLSPFSSRILPGGADGGGDASNLMMLSMDTTPVKITVEELKHMWFQKGYISTAVEELGGISFQLARHVNVADLSYDPSEEELSLTLTVGNHQRPATNSQCRLLGKYEENTVSRCDFSFELTSGFFSHSFSSSFYGSWSMDYDELQHAEHWDARPAFSLFE